MISLEGNKKSINDCILEALEQYLHLSAADQPRPAVESFSSRQYTIRMSPSLKAEIQRTAAKWQLREGLPIPMNAVVNKAITIYLKDALKY